MVVQYRTLDIVMTYPSTADEYLIGQTTMLVRNNAVAQDYGSISIVNIFCGLDNKRPESDRVNASVLADECSKADVVLISYGGGWVDLISLDAKASNFTIYKVNHFTMRCTISLAHSHNQL